ncbi:MAG: UDP-N-acetylglucosamine--N-acetylmuramyl-(pentapeptide) pyrophosphoryl-undecaprenol N-acetylglucosamine transferase [Actinobacteria bacterium]|nr:UDP-N-acetylglucosamine--N-acetylmuramyl-(pentapeptide) pyrophosphoryl-undecaprenol N-acetylglucosamine transferase [Actinomycetota bacterium]
MTAPGTWAIVAGGGTAGHVLPGISVARALVERGHEPATIHFVGADRGIEAELVPAAGFGITTLPGRGIERRLSLQNLTAIWGLLVALIRAVRLVRRRRPAVVLALGGFASAAVAFAAVLWRVPLVIAEQNARAGAVNRLVGRFAVACAVPFAETDLPNPVVTGNPVRAEILAVAAAPDAPGARSALGIPPGRTVVVVFAGSLGSRRINEAVEGALASWGDRGDLAIHHVYGSRDWEGRPESARSDAAGVDAPPDRLWYRAVRYEERMDLALAAADLVVCRAGGTTVAELAVVGVPAILVPLPIATRDHQTANAGSLQRAGAAVVVPDAALDAPRLVAEVEAVLGDGAAAGASAARHRLAAMSAAARSVGRPDAAGAVSDLVESAARRSP